MALLVKFAFETLVIRSSHGMSTTLNVEFEQGSKQFDHALPGLADSDPLHWHLQEVLDEPNVILCLRGQLLEAPGCLSAAAPAGQRLVIHRHARQNIHVCWETG